jgi:hypothetical protein
LVCVWQPATVANRQNAAISVGAMVRVEIAFIGRTSLESNRNDGSDRASTAVGLAAFMSVGDIGEENASRNFDFTDWRQKFS